MFITFYTFAYKSRLTNYNECFKYFRNFNKSIEDDIGHNDQPTDHLKDDVKTLNSQIRKDSGIRINDSIEETDDEEESKTKNLAKYLGMKDGVSASIASQVKYFAYALDLDAI